MKPAVFILDDERSLCEALKFSLKSDYTVEYSPKEIDVRGEVSIMDTYIANNGFKLSLEGNRKKYVGTHEYTIPIDTTIEIVSDARDSDFSDGIKVSVTVTEKKKAEG